MSLLQMTFSGSCMILIAALLRKIALHRLPKRMFVALWMIASLRMLLPVELPSRWSVFALFSQDSAVNAGESIAVRTAATGTAIPMQVSSGVDWRAVIWLSGMLVCAIFFLWTWLRSMRAFREALPVQSEKIDAFLKAHPLRRSVSVRRCESVSAPLTYGWLRPIILLPKNVEEERLELILCHEWVHIRRFDVLKKAIMAAAVCVHWFNPMAWLMLSLANRDIELACDEQVLRICGERRAYAMTLVAMEEARSFSEPLFNHFSKNQTEERIVAIMKMQSKSRLSLFFAVLLVLCTSVAFATTAPEEENPYAQYEPFGLIYDESEARLYFNGQPVRYFEDIYPLGDDGEVAGTVLSQSDGEVDVHAVRDLSGAIVRNEDGTFDPSGVLIGVEAYSQEEFDARTKEYEEGEAFPYHAQKTIFITGEDGEVEYVEAQPYESDGPTSVFISSEDGEYTFSLNDADVFYSEGMSVGIIGGADGPTSVYVTDGAENVEDGEISPEMFAEYEAFGLSVQDDALYFEGQRVRHFTDTYKVDFFRTVSCEHYDEEGVVDVIAIRDGDELIALEIAK